MKGNTSCSVVDAMDNTVVYSLVNSIVNPMESTIVSAIEFP